MVITVASVSWLNIQNRPKSKSQNNEHQVLKISGIIFEVVQIRFLSIPPPMCFVIFLWYAVDYCDLGINFCLFFFK